MNFAPLHFDALVRGHLPDVTARWNEPPPGLAVLRVSPQLEFGGLLDWHVAVSPRLETLPAYTPNGAIMLRKLPAIAQQRPPRVFAAQRKSRNCVRARY